MRPRRSEGVTTRAWRALALLTLAGAARAADAQSINEAGAQSLVLPLGARTVGIGGAAVAGQFGAESQRSNPAGLGFVTSPAAICWGSCCRRTVWGRSPRPAIW